MEEKEIAYVIVIGPDGEFRRFESRRLDKKRVATFLVPKGVSRTSAPKANTLWDNGKYVLGLEESHQKYNNLFIRRIRDVADFAPHDDSAHALCLFYELPLEERLRQMSADPLFDEVKNNLSVNFSFLLDGDDRLIAEKAEIVPPDQEFSDDIPSGICLITGKKGPIVRLTTPTPVVGNSPMATLVGFQVKSGYDSYGREQAYNAPISPAAEFAYTSALKYLTRKDSENKIVIGGRTFLFWGNTPAAAPVEKGLISFSSVSGEKKDDPNENMYQVKKLFESIWSGNIKTSLDDRFYILGLAPNTGRIAVVSWGDLSLKEFAGHILRHFENMEIPSKFPVCGIFTMLSAVTLGGKVSDVLPSLVEGVLSAIVFGTHYPFALYTGALERIRAELPDKQVSPSRVAILKAYINRVNQLNNKIHPLKPMLEKNYDNSGYLCGRLAAVLEKIQEDAKSGDSIRTRYLSAASITPAAVFPAMLSLSIHHKDNLSDPSRIFYQKIEQEIISKLSPEGFPTQLDIKDQGRFFVGYYQQRDDLFTKKDKTEN